MTKQGYSTDRKSDIGVTNLLPGTKVALYQEERLKHPGEGLALTGERRRTSSLKLLNSFEDKDYPDRLPKVTSVDPEISSIMGTMVKTSLEGGGPEPVVHAWPFTHIYEGIAMVSGAHLATRQAMALVAHWREGS